MKVTLKMSKYQYDKLLEESSYGGLEISIYSYEEKEIKMLDILDSYIGAISNEKLYKKLKKMKEKLEKTLPIEVKEAKKRVRVLDWEPQRLEVLKIEPEDKK